MDALCFLFLAGTVSRHEIDWLILKYANWLSFFTSRIDPVKEYADKTTFEERDEGGGGMVIDVLEVTDINDFEV